MKICYIALSLCVATSLIATTPNEEAIQKENQTEIMVVGQAEANNDQAVYSNIKMVEKGDKLTTGHITNVEDALKNVAGVTVNTTSQGVIDIRGQGGKARANVQVLLNGMPLNFSKTNRYFPGYNVIPASALSSIEVIPGGGAVIYGNGTQGGVINLTTNFMNGGKNPNFIYFGLGTYNANTRALSYRTNELLGGKLSIGINYSGDNNKLFRKGESTNSDYYNLATEYRFNDNHKVIYSFSEYKEDGKFSDYIDKNVVDQNYNASSGLRDRNRYLITNQFEYKGKIGNVDLSNNFFVTHTDWQTDTTGHEPVRNDTIGNKTQGKINYWNNGSFLLLGTDIIALEELVEMNRIKDDAIFNKQTYAAYALNKTYFGNFYSTQGYRYNLDFWKRDGDMLKKTSNTQVVERGVFKERYQNNAGELSFGYEGNNSNTWIKAEIGFSAPGPTSFMNTIDKNYVQNDVKYENFITYEIGNKTYITPNFNIKSAIFYTDTKNEIESVSGKDLVTSPNGGQTPENSYTLNVGNSIRKGVELGFDYTFYKDKVNIFSSVTYVDARLKSINEDLVNSYKGLVDEQDIDDALEALLVSKGKRMIQVPPVSIVGGASYNFTNNIKLSGVANYLSGYYVEETRTLKLDNRFLVDFDIRYDGEKYNFGAGVKNAFDEHYYSSMTTGRGGVTVLQGQGRYIYADIKYKF